MGKKRRQLLLPPSSDPDKKIRLNSRGKRNPGGKDLWLGFLFFGGARHFFSAFLFLWYADNSPLEKSPWPFQIVFSTLSDRNPTFIFWQEKKKLSSWGNKLYKFYSTGKNTLSEHKKKVLRPRLISLKTLKRLLQVGK